MNENNPGNTVGNVKIAEEVIATIASVTTLNISGVAAMSSGLIDGISGFLGKKNATKGVKVTLGEFDVAVDLSLIVDYGCKIPDVAWDVQQSVKKEIETMTGLIVSKVDVRIEGTVIAKPAPAPEPEVEVEVDVEVDVEEQPQTEQPEQPNEV